MPRSEPSNGETTVDDAASRAEIERLGEGRESETLVWGENRVLRLLRNPAHGERLDRERVALSAARRAGVRVPTAFGPETLDGRPGLVIERVDGPDLLSLLEQRPWLLPRVGRILGETHVRVHAATVAEGLPTVHERIRQAIVESELVPSQLRTPALRRLETLPDGNNLCHWDFQPANVISGGAGPVVIDWTFAARGDPAADVARTRLILKVGEPPSDSSFVIRRLDGLGRRLLSRIYLSAYRKARPIDLALVDRWEALVAIVRLTAGIEEERDRLIAIVEAVRADMA
jgi:aminoglycoside phosphotransferase (APT) family kinase protein